MGGVGREGGVGNGGRGEEREGNEGRVKEHQDIERLPGCGL